MTTLTDAELEARVRLTLATVADHTAMAEELLYQDVSMPPGRRRPRWALTAVAAAVVVAVALGGVALTGGDGRVGLRPPAGPVEAPPGAPAVLGGPLFEGEGTPDEVAEAYLRSRFTDYPAPGVEVGEVQVDGARAVVDWSTPVARGTLSMVRSDGGWTVTAAAADDIEVLGPTLEDGRLRVAFRNHSEQSLFVDVVGTDGRTWFTAALPGYVIDLPRVDQPAIIRARLLGGTVLGITELWVRPEMEKGTAVAAGAWTGGLWEMVRSDRCAWVELELGPKGTTCDFAPVEAAFSVLGPVARVDEDTLYFGILGPQVAKVRSVQADGQVIDHVPVDGVAVFAIPTAGPADIVLLDANDAEVYRQPHVAGGPIGG